MTHHGFSDRIFAVVNGYKLCLDVTLPDGVEEPPLIVYIHGGGWRQGSYKNNRMPWLVDHGFAVASISYRLTDKAVFPAQIHDCKGAVRWLRANTKQFGYDATRLAVAGGSAGAHLAMLLGMSPGVTELEGEIGGNTEQSTHVSAIVQYFGPSDFLLRAETQPNTATASDRGSFKLLNGEATGHIDMELAKQASPVFYVNEQSPPLLSFQGLADNIVLPDQAYRIDRAYEEKGCPHELVLVQDAGHGAQVLFEGECRKRAIEFLRKYV